MHACKCYESLPHIVFLQTYDKARNAVALALSPVVRAIVDPDGAMRDIRNLDSVSRNLSFSFPVDSLCDS